jgi:formylglycine-generating enzyme required for sulfatase activity
MQARRFFCVLILGVLLFTAHGQNLSMKYFDLADGDQTANTAGTSVLDQNGQKCALIKVQTAYTDFSFDAGSLGVVKTEQKTGEIWVYVPEGVKRLTISHQQFGVLRDCDLGMMLRRGRTYLMKLTTAEVKTVIGKASEQTTGDAEISSTPNMADIYIDGKKVGLTPMTISQLPFGDHEVRLIKEGCTDYTATLSVKKNETAKMDVVLNRFLTPYYVEDVCFNMRQVEGGVFMMGTPNPYHDKPVEDSEPCHEVTLSSFQLSETEVTQELWQAVMGSNPSVSKGAKKPVENVSWDDCQTFIGKLNELTDKQFRLPTEAEWEYAAAGGNKSREYKFSGSNNEEKVAWHRGNSGETTHDVKTKKANEIGLFDMSGNVWEWCQDWYAENYKDAGTNNPTGPAKGTERVNRGCACNDAPHPIQYRGHGKPADRNKYIGLRLAL